MNLKSYLAIDDRTLVRFDDVYAGYRMLHEAPGQCRPMIVVNTPLDGQPTWEERLADPMVMLQAELNAIHPHLEIGDDRVPTVRVQFGTAQIAAAFGCEMYIPPNTPPAAGTHVLTDLADVHRLKMPSPDAGWYGKLNAWTELWLRNLPEGVHIQHPDIQSPFNSSHLIRGNDIFTDFFDAPEELGILLDKVTDYLHCDFFELCKRAPQGLVLTQNEALRPGANELKRLLDGDWPEKRNIIIFAEAPSLEDGKRLYARLRESIPY